MKRLVAAAAMLSLVTTPAVAIDPPDQILALYYIWGQWTDRCAGRSPEITPKVHEAVRKTVQAVEQMILTARPESEREQFKQKAMELAAKEIAKQEPDAERKVCDNAKMFLTSWSIYTMNLEAVLKDIERLQPGRGKQ